MQKIVFLILSLCFFISACQDKANKIETLDQALEEENTWHWLATDQMKSRNGESMGYLVNLNQSSKKLMIYLQGGGSCFSKLTCSANANKFREQEANALLHTNAPFSGIFNREDIDNPFQNWNMIWIPYATGDLHGGTNENANIPNGPSNQKMVGFYNIGFVLSQVAPFLKDRGLDEVVFCGTSAGGFGTLLNFQQVAETFDGIKMTYLNDAGPVFFGIDILAPCMHQSIIETFEIPVPDDFFNIVTDTSYDYTMQGFYEYYAKKYPNVNYGFISTYEDSNIRTYYGNGLNNCSSTSAILGSDYRAGLLALKDKFDELGNWNVFLYEGEKHTILIEEEMYFKRVNGKNLYDWIAELIDGTAENILE